MNRRVYRNTVMDSFRLFVQRVTETESTTVCLCGEVIVKVEGSYVKIGPRWLQDFVSVPADGEFSHVYLN